MTVDIQTIGLTSGYALPVFTAGGLQSTVVKVTGGDSLYYGSPTVSSSSNTGTLTNGSSLTVTAITWLISAGASQVQITNYPGGGDLEAEFGTWTPVYEIQGLTLAGGVAAAQLVATGPLDTFVAVAGTATGQGMFYLDPTLFPVGNTARTAKIRVRGNVTTNTVAPACTSFVYSLVPVATVGGGSNAVPTIATVSAATATATIATPAATTQTVGTGTSVAMPAAGWFCLTLTIGVGGTAANAVTSHGFELQVQRSAP